MITYQHRGSAPPNWREKMSRMRLYYEWVVEELDPSDADEIIDCNHFETLADAIAEAAKTSCAAVVLLKHYAVVNAGDSEPFDEDGRAYAYIVDGELEEEFDDETPVPIKFRKQVAALA